MQSVFGAKASPFVILCVYPTHTISLLGISEFVVQAMETMREHPELLGKSLIFFPRLYHTCNFPFRPVSVHTRVYRLFMPSQVPCLTRFPNPERGVFVPLCTLHLRG